MGFQQGLSGLNAASKNLDVIANNVANANTVGFKASIAQFADVYANSLAGAGGGQIGIGTRLATVAQQFTQGNITVTNNPLDVAINGNGFFRLSENGAITYSRNGQFHTDKDGYIVNASGKRLTGYTTVDGVLNTAAPVELRIDTADLPPQATASVAAKVNLDSRSAVISAPFDINDPTTYTSSTAATVYDSLGNPHTLSIYFVKTGANTWSVYGALDGTQIGTGALGNLNFTASGNIDTATTTLPFVVSAPVTTGAVTPLTFELDFTGSTQFGSPFSMNALTQDGYGPGRLTGFNIGDDGTIVARYTNGQSRVMGQVVLVSFANPKGLQPLGDNAWAQTADSGQPLVGSPGSSNLGLLQSAAVEDSNVDLTQELVNMITAQRVYQANAQTIKTQDAVMQTLVNLR
ncbi:flagellar hook protein FlgE [Pelomicrobium methylotrophicum]|uniref:Flagellar hook protein FlgE n=1 Tax=Pelomicrobium methylotrophicum TaxID=2602750 RepID=A0A5C7EUT8_9PROT|nr:flagellar hook protein FlgE [Pelomicrobium methylotrophicum]TXF11823.1 flagellar hook protein FlgE [Pelomicrobium methylotrophicum]